MDNGETINEQWTKCLEEYERVNIDYSEPKGIGKMRDMQYRLLAYMIWKEKDFHLVNGGMTFYDMFPRLKTTVFALIERQKFIEKDQPTPTIETVIENGVNSPANALQGYDTPPKTPVLVSRGTLILAKKKMIRFWKRDLKTKQSCLTYLIFQGNAMLTEASSLLDYDIVVTEHEKLSENVKQQNDIFYKIYWRRIVIEDRGSFWDTAEPQFDAFCKLNARSRWILLSFFEPFLDDNYPLMKMMRFKPFDRKEVWDDFTKKPYMEENLKRLEECIAIRRKPYKPSGKKKKQAKSLWKQQIKNRDRKIEELRTAGKHH